MIDKCSCGATCSEVERLEARLAVIQDAADHCLVDVCPVKTPAVYAALWGEVES